MKRGRRLTKPQPFQRKAFRQTVERLKRWQGIAKADCLFYGHKFNPILGCCQQCGEEMSGIGTLQIQAEGKSLSNFKVEISVDQKNWQDITQNARGFLQK